MKKKILLIVVVLIIVMLVPIPMKLKDGGSTEYKAILYSVTKYHKINHDSTKGYDDGWKVKLFGLTIYDKITTYVSVEHVISIKNDNMTVKANTGSFCYKNGECLDKIDFKDFSYDVITAISDDKLYIDNLDGNIKSIELYDYSEKNFLEKPVDFTNEYIITPNTNGLYIFKINAIYEDKDISYYFMCEIKNTLSAQ